MSPSLKNQMRSGWLVCCHCHALVDAARTLQGITDSLGLIVDPEVRARAMCELRGARFRQTVAAENLVDLLQG